MSVADLRGRDLLQLGLVGFEQALPEDLDALGDRRLVGGRGCGGAAEQEVPGPDRNGSRDREITTRYVHAVLLDRWIDYRPTSDCFILTIASMCSRGESREPIVFTDRCVAPRSRHSRARCAHSAGPPME